MINKIGNSGDNLNTKDVFKDYTFKELYQKLGKPKYIINIKKFEVYFSIICSLILFIINYYFVTSNLDNNISFIVTTVQNMLLYSIAGLLGMLGFIISGLAIISGTIGNKVTHEIIIEKKSKSLLSILFSFYYLGFVVGILLIICMCCYFIMGINFKFYFYWYIIISLFITYGFFFSIFYAISLLGTCIHMFMINYIYSQPNTNAMSKTNKNEVELVFKDLRIDTLTKILLSKNIITAEEFINELKDVIKNDCPKEYIKAIEEIYKEYYSIEEDN